MPSNPTFASLCPGCFAEKANANVCPHCGYDESQKRGPLVLPHRTLLNNGQYLIGKVLGKPGGFGITYLAFDTKLETKVAIKEYLPRDLAGRDGGHATISAHSAEDAEHFRYGLTQFLQEARTLARFDHANIVRVRNFFEENGTGYLVMDYYDGITLADYLAQQPQGKLPEQTAVDILMPILDGLREVHAKNMLHRDIKPQNIYLTTGNRAILLDFGAARQAMSECSRSLSVVLSEGYAPYEQYHRRGEQGPWTDIYASAAVLYHMVAGEAPPPATERLQNDELDIVKLGLPASLTAALRMGLAVDHKDRPQRMTEFQALLLGSSAPVLTDVVERKSQKTDVAAKERMTAHRPVDLNKGKSLPKRKMWWASALAVAIVIAAVALGSKEKKNTSPDASVVAPSAVPPAPPSAKPTATTEEDLDTQSWNKAKASGERQSLEAYLKQYPRGKYVELAEIELTKLDERDALALKKAEDAKEQAAEQLKAAEQIRAEKDRIEQQAWEAAKAENTPDAYTAYLNAYPKGRFSFLARNLLQTAKENVVKQERLAAEELARREQEAKRQAAEALHREQEAREASQRVQVAKESAVIRNVYDSIRQIIELHIAAVILQSKPDVDRKRNYLIAFIRENDADNLDLIRKAANAGDPISQFCLGAMYFDGLGITSDGSEGIRWIRKAAEQNNEAAAFLLGIALTQGSGTPKNESEGIRWIREAAAQKNATAALFLGLAHMQGKLIQKDENEAFRWIQKSTDLGNPLAVIALAGAYYKGVGVAKDEFEAKRLLREAVTKNNAASKLAKSSLDKIEKSD